MKRISGITGIVVLLIICLGAWASFGKNITETDAIYIEITKLEDGNFNTNGSFTGGAMKYSGYDYKIEGETMYLSIKNRLFVGNTGDFLIEIKDDELRKVKKVYLQGKEKSDTYQLWPILEE